MANDHFYRVSSFKVEKGCCQFHMDEVYNKPLFTTMNWEDASLRGVRLTIPISSASNGFEFQNHQEHP
jgi:hypothetical protein